MKTYKEDDSDALKHDIHIWIGADSTQDEYGTAAYKMVEADEYLGGVPVQHRQVQGAESGQFQGYFDSLTYHDGGVESGFNHVEPTVEKPLLFRVKSSGKQILMTQMALSKSSLNEGDSFILYGDKAHVWCWNGSAVSQFCSCRFSFGWGSGVVLKASLVLTPTTMPFFESLSL